MIGGTIFYINRKLKIMDTIKDKKFANLLFKVNLITLLIDLIYPFAGIGVSICGCFGAGINWIGAGIGLFICKFIPILGLVVWLVILLCHLIFHFRAMSGRVNIMG
jgi:hypothetical protein